MFVVLVLGKGYLGFKMVRGNRAGKIFLAASWEESPCVYGHRERAL